MSAVIERDPEKTQETSHDADGIVKPNARLRARAFVVGIPLAIAISAISVYGDMVVKSIQFGVLQLTPPAVVGLLLLVVCNRRLSHLFKRELLNATEMLAIYVMLLVSVMVSSRGAVERIIPPLVYLPYHNSTANPYNELLGRWLPRWLSPYPAASNGSCPEGIRAYYEGIRMGDHVNFMAWIGPLCSIFVLFGFVIWIFVCLAVLMRRQWVENERLSFPLAALPVALIRNEIDGEPLLSNKVLWAGFLIPVVAFTVNGIHQNCPSVPSIPLVIQINPILTTPPWNQVDTVMMCVSFAAIGFAYLLPNDLLFSLWFFFILARVEDVICYNAGFPLQSIGTQNARVFTGYQAAGAYLVLVGSYLILAKPHLANVWRTAFGHQKPLDDSAEMLRYRAAIFGIAAGFVGVVAWLTLAGMSVWLAALIMGVYIFVVAIVMTRAVSEIGLLITETSFLPTHLLALAVPTASLGPANLTLTALLDTFFNRDLRGFMLSPLMDAQKIAAELRIRARNILAPFVVAVVIALIVGSATFLYLSYRYGHLNLLWYPDANVGWMYQRAAGIITSGHTSQDPTAGWGFAVGIVAAFAMVRLRMIFPWFALHPLAYAMAPTWAMIVLWFPCFIAWSIKVPTLRYGGMLAYKRLRPFMLGMILGEFTMAMIWAILASPAIRLSAPAFPWP